MQWLGTRYDKEKLKLTFWILIELPVERLDEPEIQVRSFYINSVVQGGVQYTRVLFKY